MSRAPIVPQGRLALLVLAVLTAHVVLLRWLQPPPPGPAPVRGVVTTRAIEVPAPAAAEPQSVPQAPPAAAAPATLRREPQPAAGRGTGQADAAGGRPLPPTEPPPPSAAPAGSGLVEPPPPPAIPPNVRRGPAAALQPGRALLIGDLLLPGSAQLQYAVSGRLRRRDVDGQSALHWLHDGDRYEARMESTGVFARPRMQSSTGVIGASGLEPARYADRTRSELAAHFQRDAGRVSFSATSSDAALEAGMQDRVSAFVQLAGMIAAQPQRYAAGTRLELAAIGARGADSWVLVVEGEETLSIGDSTLATLKLVRRSRAEYDPVLELWLAPALDYLPARIRLTWPHGDWVDQLWRSTDRR